MNQRLIKEIGRTQRLQILNILKRTQGLSVNELAARLKMSYMGVKQHCVELASDGYLDTWRRPKPIGRPEMVYRLTRRSHELFPESANEVTIELLESAKKLYGLAAPEKLLLLVFQRKTESYVERLRGETLSERARSLARIRDQEGHMAEFEENDGVRIVEYNCPLQDLLTKFPIIARLEKEMFERVLKAPVTREEQTVSGLFRSTFTIG